MGNGFESLAQMMDRLSAARTAEEKWATAQSIAAEAGLNAHNVGTVRLDTGALTYMRSDMTAAWLEEYVEEAYFTADPFVHMVQEAPTHRVLRMRDGRGESHKERELRGRVADEGYRLGFGETFVSDKVGERRVVTLFSEEDSVREWCAERHAQLRAISLVFNAHLFGDGYVQGQVLAPSHALSGRERDVLLLLASGLQNQQIADRLGVAEVTVRMHFARARKKLSARTREQALAIALRDNLIVF